MSKINADTLIIGTIVAIVGWCVIGLPIFGASLHEGHWPAHLPDWFVAAFTLVLAVVTSLLVRSTNRLWEATKNAAERQEADTRILQRAYIAVEPLGINLMLNGHDLIGNLAIQNSGHLPASRVAWTIHQKVSINGEDEEFPLGNYSGNIVIVPGARSLRSSDKQSTIQEAQLLAGDSHQDDRARETPTYIFVWGGVRYDDGFGQMRTTTFCHRYNWQIRGKETTSGYEIAARFARIHEFGNNAY
jgi:hypothetical protein